MDETTNETTNENTTTNWISINGKRPHEGEQVLVSVVWWNGEVGVDTDTYRDGSWEWYEHPDEPGTRVYAWAKLPKPMKLPEELEAFINFWEKK